MGRFFSERMYDFDYPKGTGETRWTRIELSPPPRERGPEERISFDFYSRFRSSNLILERISLLHRHGDKESGC